MTFSSQLLDAKAPQALGNKFTIVRSSQLELAVVPLADVLPLRHRILRPGQPLAAAYLPQDALSDAVHTSARLGSEIIAVASFYRESAPEYHYENSWRLRGMATGEDYRGVGIGGSLLLFGLERMVARHADYVWCHARLTAEGFYRRFGFVSYGEPFMVQEIGLHVKMGCVLFR